MSNISLIQRAKAPRRARGFMLLEVLVSILLFALGFVALMGLQGKSLAVTQDVEYRAEAVRLANAYVAKMWAFQNAQNAASSLKTRFTDGGNEYNKFKDQIVGNPSTGQPGIPGGLAPVVNITPYSRQLTLPTNDVVNMEYAEVSITIEWVSVNRENKEVVHNYTHSTSIGFPLVKPQTMATI